MKKNKWINLINFVNATAEENGIEKTSLRFFHYTSLPVLFGILEKDECWISNARFSNDSSEEMLLGDLREEKDDYIMCFCSNGDQLSQWRGYCSNGGASIEFFFAQPLEYSVLWSKHELPTDYEIYENRPIPVIYFRNKPSMDDIQLFKHFVQEWSDEPRLEVEELWPYIKNGLFMEEHELRMAFSNDQGKLSKCIRFRTLENGVKVPYMVIKCGDIGKMNGKCDMNTEDFTDDYIKEHFDELHPVWIPEGSDQEKIYNQVRDKVKKCVLENCLDEIPIFCKGHFPITKIKIAPCDNCVRIVEQVKRFCQSKYWLRDVKVEPSEIPYVKSLT